MKQKLTLLLLAFYATFAFAATQGQRRADGNSLLIKFDAGSLANTYSDGEFVFTRTADTDNKHAIDGNSVYFGTAESYVKFDYRFKTGGKSSDKNSLQLTIPTAGTLKVYARTASSSATDRNVVLTQDGTELYNAVVKDADAVDVVINEESKKVYPVIAVEVNAGTVDVTYPVGALNFYGFELATAGEEAGPKNIEISPESGTDIAVELASAMESVEAVGNITINLAEDGEYTVGASIVASQSLVINGNGAKIDASALSDAFINYASVTGEKAKKADDSESEYTIVDKVSVKDVEITGLGQSFINNAAGKVLFKEVVVDNAVIMVKGSKTIFALSSGYPEDLKITNSTLWSEDGHAGYLFQSHGKAPDINPDYKTSWTIDKSTLYQISVGKQANNSNTFKGKNYLVMTLTNSILYNFGSNTGNEVKGWLFGQNSTTPTITYENNTYWSADGAVAGWTDSSKQGSDQSETALTTDPYFRDPVNGDFALEAGSEQALNKTGDPHWGTWSAPGTEYVITVDEAENGTVAVDVVKAEQGTEVTVTATPAEGYEVDVITVKDADGTEITVTEGKFIMPGKPVTVTATFKLSTGIEAVKTAGETSLENAVIYNLNGQRVEKAQKGINFVNGKKVIIK